MPRGMNPNSQKALAENRHKGQFKAGEKKVREDIEKGRETKAKRRSFREQLEIALSAEVTLKDKDGKPVGKTTVYEQGITMMMRKYANGDLRTIEFVRDSIGEKPAENIVISSVDPETINEIEKMVYDS